MASLSLQPSLILFLFLFLKSLSLSLSSTCTSPNLQSSFKLCNELPSLSSSLHFTYNSSNNTLSIAFTSSPPSPSGWIAWGINPVSTGMAGTQALLAYRNSDGSMSVKTYNISSYSDVIPGDLSFKVFEKKAVFNSGDGSITIFAMVENHGGKVNHVWQVGPGVTQGVPQKHDFKPQNLAAKGTLDLTVSGGGGGGGTSVPDSGSGSNDPITKKKNVGFFVSSFGFVVWFIL